MRPSIAPVVLGAAFLALLLVPHDAFADATSAQVALKWLPTQSWLLNAQITARTVGSRNIALISAAFSSGEAA